jgi:hypothetical protein
MSRAKANVAGAKLSKAQYQNPDDHYKGEAVQGNKHRQRGCQVGDLKQ